MARAQSGDPGAMEEVLRTAHTPVTYQCRKLLRDPRDAEDEEGYSVRDIAASLGVPENTVKNRLNYARKARERVLDYERKGVKLYGLSPLPFMLFFLLRATSQNADGAKAATVAGQVMEAGAAAVLRQCAGD